MKRKGILNKTVLMECISVFSVQDRRKITFVILLQIGLGVLDLIGVAVIGILGALAVTGIQSSQPGNRVNMVLDLLNLGKTPFQTQVAILGVLATVILISRSILSMLINRKVFFFIARRSAEITKNLISRILTLDNLQITKQTPQHTIYLLTTGVGAITLGVVGSFMSLIADSSLLLVILVGLLVVDPVLALSTIIFFAIIGIILYQKMHKTALVLGNKSTNFNIFSNEKIEEVLTSYREALVRNRRGYYADVIGDSRFKISNVQAEQSFLPSISKYVIEISMVVGALLISTLQFTFQDAKHAIATLAVFMAAATRIAPAILRVQQGSIAIKSNIGAAQLTLNLIKELPKDFPKDIVSDSSVTRFLHHSDFIPKVKIEHLSFKYPVSEKDTLVDISLEVPEGDFCAVVGPSGAGKTTLVDIILGAIPSSNTGEVMISGMPPLEAISKYPGAIGYVPQNVEIYSGTLRYNIALGFPAEEYPDELFFDALKVANLDNFVRNLQNGLDTEVGSRGTKLSGGQRQRLGIARAFFTKPKLIILDESTSSLDAQTELLVTDAMKMIPYQVTLIAIAHRLSTVKSANQVVYLDRGRIVASGTFSQVRNMVSDFDTQARLMGL